MATRLSQRPLIIQDENFNTRHEKALIDGKGKNSKLASKKGGVGFGSRKALNDITNKSSLHHEPASKKKSSSKEFNVADEAFLHDHHKCIEAQRRAMEPSFWVTVFPTHDVLPSGAFPESNPKKDDLDSPRCYPEPEESALSEISDWLESSTLWVSPPLSPIHSNSPPSSPCPWDLELVDFHLKEEDDN